MKLAQKSGTALAATAALMLLAGTTADHARADAHIAKKVQCHGVNACKGTGACKSANNECKSTV